MSPRSFRIGLVGAIIAITVAGAPASSQASARPNGTLGGQPGARPDPTFGGGRGWVTTGTAGSTLFASDAVVTPNDRIVVAGQSATSGNSQVVVARYQSNGDLDKSFGSQGIFTTALPAADSAYATSIRRQPSTGGLVVAGHYKDDSILLLRLTSAGKIDPTFGAPGGNGIVTLAVGSHADSLAIDDEGRILVGSSNFGAVGQPMVVARFSPNGIPDNSFGDKGIVQLTLWNTTSASGSGVNALNVAADGSVTGEGHLDYIGAGGYGTSVVFRLSPNGQLVPGFGSDGHTEIAFMQSATVFATWYPCAMTVDPDGRMVVTGYGDVGTGPAVLTARLTPSGALDTSYGAAGNGRVVTAGLDNSVSNQTLCGAALNARDAVTTGIGAILLQLTAGGKPNTGFGPGGSVSIGVPPNVNLAAVIRAGPGRIVLVGSAALGTTSLYVARYLTR